MDLACESGLPSWRGRCGSPSELFVQGIRMIARARIPRVCFIRGINDGVDEERGEGMVRSGKLERDGLERMGSAGLAVDRKDSKRPKHRFKDPAELRVIERSNRTGYEAVQARVVEKQRDLVLERSVDCAN